MSTCTEKDCTHSIHKSARHKANAYYWREHGICACCAAKRGLHVEMRALGRCGKWRGRRMTTGGLAMAPIPNKKDKSKGGRTKA